MAADVWTPLVADWLPDGRIQARDPGGNLVEGFAPPNRAGEQGEERGLGLFVQKEAPLRLAPQGPVVGRVLPGAYLALVGMDACFAEFVVRGFSRWPSIGGSKELKAFVPVGALGTKEVSLAPQPRGIRDLKDHRRGLLAEPGKDATAFSETRCGRLRVLESRQVQGRTEPLQRVAQEQGGVELHGWVDRPLLEARGDFRCPPRVLQQGQVISFGAQSLPEGFGRAGDAEAVAKEYASLTKKERSVFVPVVDGEAVTCKAFKLKSRGAELSRDDERNGKKVALRYQVRLSGSHLTLAGPCRGKDASQGTCSAPYTLVQARADRVDLLPVREPASDAARPIVAYHEDDAEPWFFDRAACELRGGVAHASSLLQ